MLNKNRRDPTSYRSVARSGLFSRRGVRPKHDPFTRYLFPNSSPVSALPDMSRHNYLSCAKKKYSIPINTVEGQGRGVLTPKTPPPWFRHCYKYFNLTHQHLSRCGTTVSKSKLIPETVLVSFLFFFLLFFSDSTAVLHKLNMTRYTGAYNRHVRTQILL